MTERISTTSENLESAEFSHAAEWLLECNAASSSVIVTVSAKIETAADYVVIDEFVAPASPIKRYAAMPFVKVKIRGNAAAATIKVWSV